MKCEEAKLLLDDLVDGSLSTNDRLDVETHMLECSECRSHVEFLHGLNVEVVKLPKIIPPPRNLWKGISERLDEPETVVANIEMMRRRNGKALPDRESISLNSARRLSRMSWKVKSFTVAACALVVVSGTWFAVQLSTPSWNVARLEGVLKIGSERIGENGKLRVGDWLETDNTSRARIDVGLIGEVEVEPNSKLRLLQAQTTDHRVELQKGTIHARIWAPPRLFFVETPSATAIDLGCAYTLTVSENGAGLLKVSAGYVALNRDGKESIVPAGAACETRPGVGPGTPFRLSAKEDFRQALSHFDFEQGGAETLSSILSKARKEDGITLWHLLSQTSGTEKVTVYETLASFIQPPPGVTCDGILQDDKRMMAQWAENIGINY